MRVYRCTQLARSTLAGRSLTWSWKGVLEDGHVVWLGAPDTRLPYRLWEWTTRKSRRRQYQPGGRAPE